MAKRLTDTGKWSKKWMRGLPAAYKLLWVYLCDVCDHAGTWEVDMETAMLHTGEALDVERALDVFGDRVMVLDAGCRWLLTGFVRWQYANEHGLVSEGNKILPAVKKTLAKWGLTVNKYGACIPLVSPMEGGIYKYTDKEEVITTVVSTESNKSVNIPPSMEHQSPINPPSMGDIKLPWEGDEFAAKWKVWKDYKWQQHQWRYGYHQEVHALEQLWLTANGDVKLAIELIGNCISKGYKNIGNYASGKQGTEKRAAITSGKLIDSNEGFFKKR